MTLPKYVGRILRAYSRGITRIGEPWVWTVAHEDSCPFLRRHGECTCVPGVTATNEADGRVVEVEPNGTVVEMGRN